MNYFIKEVDWPSYQAQISAVRQQVFIVEQQVPAALEWDGLDETAQHLLALSEDGKAIGCARVLSDASIGRMAVLADWRSQGVGQALLKSAIQLCRENGWLDIQLSAQTHAIAFYERAGFKVSSDEYMDAGIPHKAMKLRLDSRTS